VRLRWLENAYSHPLLRWSILTNKVGQTNLFLVCDEASLVGLCMQDYTSLFAAVTICATLINIQTHRQTDTQRAFWPAI